MKTLPGDPSASKHPAALSFLIIPYSSQPNISHDVHNKKSSSPSPARAERVYEGKRAVLKGKRSVLKGKRSVLKRHSRGGGNPAGFRAGKSGSAAHREKTGFLPKHARTTSRDYGHVILWRCTRTAPHILCRSRFRQQPSARMASVSSGAIFGGRTLQNQ
jgi:hypothetical protein